MKRNTAVFQNIGRYNWPLNNTGLNCMGPLIRGFFSTNTLEKKFGDCNSLKKLTGELCSLEIFLKIQKKLGMSWMYKIQVDSILSFYRHKWVIFNMKLIPLVYLQFYNCAFKEYCTVCLSLSLIIEETAYQPIITGKHFLNVTMFSILYYQCDCNTVCYKNCIMIHSLVYRPVWYSTLGSHKAIILIHCYHCMNGYTYK